MSRIGDQLEQLVAQAAAGLAALALALLGVIALAVAACVALAQVWGVPLAALATGVGLLFLALIAWLVARGGTKSHHNKAPANPRSSDPARGAAEVGAALAAGVAARPREAALIALVGGLVAGSSPELRRSLERLID